MKYTSEDGTVYKSNEDYWIHMYPMKDSDHQLVIWLQ